MNNEWRRLIEVRNEYHAILSEMLASNRGKLVECANESLRSPSERYIALSLAESFTPDELKSMFGTLVFTASWAHPHTQTARELVLKIPRQWVLDHIEPVMEPILATDDPDEFRRMLELARVLDHALLSKLCQRAVNHTNSEIREAGHDFLQGAPE